MPIGGKDAFLSKVTFRRESKWYSKTKQELKDVETIEERAIQAAYGYEDQAYSAGLYMGYKEGAEGQRKIDIDKACKCFCKTCMGQCKDTSHCDTLQKFRNELNAMEEYI